MSQAIKCDICNKALDAKENGFFRCFLKQKGHYKIAKGCSYSDVCPECWANAFPRFKYKR